MKILKVAVKKERTRTRCHYSYPKSWNSQKIHVLAYENHPENLGKVEEDCLCLTDDETAGRLLKEEGVRELSRKEANDFGRKYRPNKTRITDEQKVIQIIRKILSKTDAIKALRLFLTNEELDTLDEEKTDSGIRKGKQFDIAEFIK